MLSVIRHSKDFWSGALFLAVGSTAVFIARGYPMGTAISMGPSYFPTVLGVLLALIGLAIMVRALLQPGEAVERFAWKQIAIIQSAVVLFGLLVQGAGLLPATMVLTLVSAYASTRFKWIPSLLLAIGLTAFSGLVFVKALGLPIPLIGTWFGG